MPLAAPNHISSALARMPHGGAHPSHGAHPTTRPAAAHPGQSGQSSAHASPAGAIEAAQAQHEQVVKQTQKWVSQTFFGTLLKQMRESPFKSDLFEGGRGGQAYSELFDQRMVEHMSRSAGSGLVKSIASRIEARDAYGKQAKVRPLANPVTSIAAAMRQPLRSATAHPSQGTAQRKAKNNLPTEIYVPRR